MNKVQAIAFLILVTTIVGCTSNKPLTHNYQGDVHLRTLYVNFQQLREDTAGNDQDMFAVITKVQKVVQEIQSILDPRQERYLITQLTDFQDILIQGIRDKTGVPLVALDGAEVNLTYSDHGELSEVIFYYPEVTGPAMDLQAVVNYPTASSLYIGMEEINKQSLKVRPELDLTISGETRSGDTFWRQSVTYLSPIEYTLGNDYILGLSATRIEDGQIFLVPLANGAINKLEKSLP